MQTYDLSLESGHYASYDLEKMDCRDIYYPFFKKVSPKIAQVQQKSDYITLIHLGERNNLFKNRETGKIILDKKLGEEREKKIITSGLEPLYWAGILTTREIKTIIEWFKTPRNDHNFCKHVSVDDEKYILRTEYKEEVRRLVLIYDNHIQK